MFLLTNMIDVYIILFFLSLLATLFFIKAKKATLEQKILGCLIVVTLPCEIYGGYLQYHSINNLFIYHVLIPTQYSLYSLIFYSSIESKNVKKLIIISIPITLISAIFFSLSIQPINTYNSYVIVLTSVFTCAWILIYYRQIFVQLKIIYLEKEPLFWISTGLLFYSLGGFFVEGLMKELIEQDKKVASWYYYNVYMLLVSFLYIMFIISFLCQDIFNKSVKTH
jgi:hypothetical protein